MSAIFQQAIQSFQAKNYKQAKIILFAMLKITPKHCEGLHMMGLIFGLENEHQEALNYLHKAVKLEPDNFEINFNLAKALSEAGAHKKALQYHEIANNLNNKNPYALLNFGRSLFFLGRYDEALLCFEKALEIDPKYFEALINKGNLLHVLNRYIDALTEYDKAAKINAHDVTVINNAGLVLKDIKRYEEALDNFNRAIVLNPNFAGIWANKGAVLNKLNRYDEALVAYDQAIALDPNSVEPWYDKGVVLGDRKRYKEALEHYDQAIALNPNFFDSYWNKALIKLVLGDFEEGWNLYEYRWKRKEIEPKPQYAFKELISITNVKDKKILVWHEQGYGDTIQFCRYIPLLIDRGAQITFLVQPALLELFNNQFNCFITSSVDNNINFDYQVPLLTLPKLFKTSIASIPAVPKINIKPLKQLMWSKKLKFSKNKLNIGLATSGSPTQKNDHKRSMKLESIEPLLDQGNFFLFQKDLKKDDIEFLERRSEIIYVGDQIEDFSDTAAIIENLDIVISVCTSLVHLAGSLQKKTLLMSIWAPDWRWMLDRSNTPWYPSVQIIRQKSEGDWISVICEVSKQLKIHKN